MEYKSQEVKEVTISYRVNGHKARVVCRPDENSIKMMIAGLIRDGATDVKIMHYFNNSGVMIK